MKASVLLYDLFVLIYPEAGNGKVGPESMSMLDFLRQPLAVLAPLSRPVRAPTSEKKVLPTFIFFIHEVIYLKLDVMFDLLDKKGMKIKVKWREKF